MYTKDTCPSDTLFFSFFINQNIENYATLSEAIMDLRLKGYADDFNLKQNCIVCRDGQFKVLHNEFPIEKAIRFDVNTDPGDQSILYCVSSVKYYLKGLLVNGYGIYTEDISNEIIQKVN